MIIKLTLLSITSFLGLVLVEIVLQAGHRSLENGVTLLVGGSYGIALWRRDLFGPD